MYIQITVPIFVPDTNVKSLKVFSDTGSMSKYVEVISTSPDLEYVLVFKVNLDLGHYLINAWSVWIERARLVFTFA